MEPSQANHAKMQSATKKKMTFDVLYTGTSENDACMHACMRACMHACVHAQDYNPRPHETSTGTVYTNHRGLTHPSLAWPRPFPRRLVGGAGGGEEGRRVW